MNGVCPISLEASSKPNKLANKVTRLYPKVWDGKYDSIKLLEWVRRIEKIFEVVEVPEEKKINIRIFKLAEEDDI